MKNIKYPKFKGKEDQLQMLCASYLDLHNILYFHTPNEIKAKPQYMVKRKKMGVKSGVPDIMILEAQKGYKGFAIELKVGYNKPSENQLKWLDELNKRGWKTLITYSFEEFEACIKDYFMGNLKIN